MEKVVERVV